MVDRLVQGDQAHILLLGRDKPVKRLSDQDALGMLQYRAASGQHGRDPVHLILEKQWFVNLAFYLGLQHFDGNEVLQDIDPNFTLEDAGYIANHIQRIVAQNVARKTQSRPQWTVLPRSPDIDDQQGAKAGESLLEYFYDHMDIRGKRREGAFISETCGTWFWYVDWDKQKGRKKQVYRNPFNQQIIPPSQVGNTERQFLNAMGGVQELTEGDWELEVLLPFQVRVPHKYTRLEKMPWIVIERFVSLDDLWDKYDKKAATIPPEEIGTTEDNQYWRRLSSLVNRHGFTLPSRGGNDYEGVTLREMWQRPSKRFPNGFKIVGTRSQLLENGPHPYFKDDLDVTYPIIPIHNLELPGRFWSMSTVEHLLGPQRDYNRGRHQLIQHRDVLAVPQWLSPKQANVTSYQNNLGDIWEYEAPYKPELQSPPGISQNHIGTIDQARNDLQILAAQSDPSQAMVPTGVRSGVGIRLLQEKDMQAFGPQIDCMEQGFEQLGSRALMLFWKYGSVPRAITIHGDVRQADVIFLKGADLNQNYTVRVKRGSMMPRSKAESLEVVMNLLQLGGLNPALPQHQRMIMKVADIGDVDALFLEQDLDRRRARIENQMFLKPSPGPEFAFPDVDEDDDHQAHYEEHLLFKKTDAWEKMPPIRKVAFDAHVQKHKLAVARMIEAASLMQQASGPPQGSPPKEPGKASQPADRGGQQNQTNSETPS